MDRQGVPLTILVKYWLIIVVFIFIIGLERKRFLHHLKIEGPSIIFKSMGARGLFVKEELVIIAQRWHCKPRTSPVIFKQLEDWWMS